MFLVGVDASRCFRQRDGKQVASPRRGVAAAGLTWRHRRLTVSVCGRLDHLQRVTATGTCMSVNMTMFIEEHLDVIATQFFLRRATETKKLHETLPY